MGLKEKFLQGVTQKEVIVLASKYGIKSNENTGSCILQNVF